MAFRYIQTRGNDTRRRYIGSGDTNSVNERGAWWASTSNGSPTGSPAR
jgi:hypothetical protein